jgi:tryptophan-rich sensory protein
MKGLLGKVEMPHVKPSIAIRAVSVITYVACLILNVLNGMLGPNNVSAVSEKFKLWVTPPGFIFSIWGLIYTSVAVALYSAFYRNTWRIRTHVWFCLVNVLNALWINVWCRGTGEAMIALGACC